MFLRIERDVIIYLKIIIIKKVIFDIYVYVCDSSLLHTAEKMLQLAMRIALTGGMFYMVVSWCFQLKSNLLGVKELKFA